MEKTKRNAEIVRLRATGQKASAIAKQFGISPMRVQQIYKTEQRRVESAGEWDAGLSTRARHLFWNWEVRNREEALEFLKARSDTEMFKFRNYGWKTHQEVLKWLGLPPAIKPARRQRLPRVCPHCGKPIILSQLVNQTP